MAHMMLKMSKGQPTCTSEQTISYQKHAFTNVMADWFITKFITANDSNPPPILTT